ncbi:sporulation protein [Methylococcaceae bacterium CS1]|nr:SPOR domain-containing protein [Methyloprofundus sp.]TXK96370.1 sporulation protein [Methylococcaceae bacterium CS5]TXK99018.1 sporulation protein [Methylococcaceae bacterium CS4]TXL08498.1 sporulation protein [Methylococcaceae bacterium CS3]TXL09113.1 sporulation protein [Methylococcaceae bacterium CS1]TXL11297.1 sporulation protein [Methylococcaceae bacterium CS2]TXL19042.1 sporulation protein [Methylococcaceae bacterium HT5]
MAHDYKHRTSRSGQSPKRPPARVNKRKPAIRKRAKPKSNQEKISLGRWSVVLGIVGLFVYFLYSLSLTKPDQQATRQITKLTPKKAAKKAVAPKKIKPKQEIQYDFYTILPEAEFVIPDHEVKTRKREERVGKAKTGVQYSVQAGAFRNYKDADSLKAKLIMMGFSPKIEKAVIGSVTWHRVKMGPYNRLVSVDAIQSRLKSNKMDALVIEVKK